MSRKQRQKPRNQNNQSNHSQLSPLEITPKTENQARFFNKYDSGKSQLLLGHPGTGKTFLGMGKALTQLKEKDNEYKRLIIVRSAVPTRNQGFLPGNLGEKEEVYELPYKAICTELFGRADAYEIMKKHKYIEFTSTSYIRGLTFDNSIILADEIQNMTAHELDSVITRVGNWSKLILCGDILQRDLTNRSEKNVESVIKVLEKMTNQFDVTKFTENDIVRSGLVGDYIRQKHKIFPDGYE